MKNTMFLGIHFSLSLKEIYLFYEGDEGKRDELLCNRNDWCFANSSILAQMLIVLPSMSYAVLLDILFFTLKYSCVCVCTLCVVGAHMCKVRDRVMAGEGQSYPASVSVFIKPKPHMKNPYEVQENYHYVNKGKYILLPRDQSPSLVQ